MSNLHLIFGESGQRLIAQVERLESAMTPLCKIDRRLIETITLGEERLKMLSSLGKLAEEAL
jgi:hypothetical protein